MAARDADADLTAPGAGAAGRRRLARYVRRGSAVFAVLRPLARAGSGAVRADTVAADRQALRRAEDGGLVMRDGPRVSATPWGAALFAAAELGIRPAAILVLAVMYSHTKKCGFYVRLRAEIIDKEWDHMPWDLNEQSIWEGFRDLKARGLISAADGRGSRQQPAVPAHVMEMLEGRYDSILDRIAFPRDACLPLPPHGGIRRPYQPS